MAEGATLFPVLKAPQLHEGTGLRGTERPSPTVDQGGTRAAREPRPCPDSRRGASGPPEAVNLPWAPVSTKGSLQSPFAKPFLPNWRKTPWGTR
ncbi:Hypothetical predicted protein [Podarcis lilfordi]|uniref:Uncharacterized protein n=1 Tax=Podarcis lilfordi TaxID=74358 RepID=A0AA35NXF9_9SAUR|nr:Hypothetical predicted protein [Podarcis lilfordi]